MKYQVKQSTYPLESVRLVALCASCLSRLPTFVSIDRAQHEQEHKHGFKPLIMLGMKR